MTVPVVTVDRITPYKEITRRLAGHQVGGVPGKHRSEFRYGAFARSVTLPERADEDRIRASYDRGVLEVVVNLKDQAAVQADKRIPVRTKAHIKPT